MGRFEARKCNDDKWEQGYLNVQKSITIPIFHLKRMKKLVVECVEDYQNTPLGLMPGMRTGFRKVTGGFLYGHDFNISVNQRRRLAETPKPLGWKPSQDMDWSPEYRQRRR